MPFTDETDVNQDLEVLTHTIIATGGGADPAAVTSTYAVKGFVVQIHVDIQTAPDASWDLLLTDENGVDLTNGNGIAVGTADITFTQTDLANGMAATGQLTIEGNDLSNASSGAIVSVYIARYR